MGLFNIFDTEKEKPIIISILPDIAKQEIYSGRLPILKTDKLFLKKGENCHFIERAIYEKKIVSKKYLRNNRGYSFPGFLKGTRIHVGGGTTDVVNNTDYKIFRGIIYITNKRIIFASGDNGFNKNINDLIAIMPCSNCVDLQFTKENIRLFVPDGNIIKAVLHQIK